MALDPGSESNPLSAKLLGQSVRAGLQGGRFLGKKLRGRRGRARKRTFPASAHTLARGMSDVLTWGNVGAA